MQREPARDEVAKRGEMVGGTEQQAAGKNRSGKVTGPRELVVGKGSDRLVDQSPVTMPGTYRRPRTAPAACDQPLTAHSPAADSANSGTADAVNGAATSTVNITTPLITMAVVVLTANANRRPGVDTGIDE